MNTGVSIITCTNRLYYKNNIFENYQSQDYVNKELIIVLNNNKLIPSNWIEHAKKHMNVKIFRIDEKISLGECLNFAVSQANFDIIAKFDDDDYYAPKYLSESIKAFDYTEANVIGKSTSYVYFEDSKILGIRNPKKENRYVYRIEGSTLIIKKEVFDTVRFQHKSLGEDVQFCKDCVKNKIRIYSLNKNNHVYIRHNSSSKHTWNIRDDYYMKLCQIIGEVDDYKTYIEK